ncbi:non-heme iron oxygenase ferredoxin subunit [Cellulomonas bogoriensis]|uniref:(2Fe-2S)-binding protein n=1 Tax=Cellulomonas bogoriensis 69B4 = DSM 16987 TaxID=1386082 RepID=A0A0A0C0G1_9CELL|nr:non-heme iron oxygenase ferredoxin subunit [Cellulomonas bogoriensis]KGM13665.1 (2Fe-2S)-binding protein [Cellulomonas bogoriensis 69B4 = DSM 16987]
MTAQLACTIHDVAPGAALRVELEGPQGPVEVAVVRDSDGTFHAVSDLCSHGQVSLSDGDVDGCTIECWLHGSTFDLRSGQPLALPATRPVPVYPVTVDGERVLVDVETTVNA